MIILKKCNKILDTSDLVFTLDFNDLKRASIRFSHQSIQRDNHNDRPSPKNPVGYSDIEISEPNITSNLRK